MVVQVGLENKTGFNIYAKNGVIHSIRVNDHEVGRRTKNDSKLPRTMTYTDAAVRAERLLDTQKRLIKVGGRQNTVDYLEALLEQVMSAIEEAQIQFHDSRDHKTNGLCRTLEGKDQQGNVIVHETDPDEDEIYLLHAQYPSVRKDEITLIIKSDQYNNEQKRNLIQRLHQQRETEKEWEEMNAGK